MRNLLFSSGDSLPLCSAAHGTPSCLKWFAYIYHKRHRQSCNVLQVCACRVSKRREEEVAKQADNEEANDPVDWVDVNDDHVHVKAPALRVVLEVHRVQTIATSVRVLPPADGCGRPLEACIGWRSNMVTWWCGLKDLAATCSLLGSGRKRERERGRKRVRDYCHCHVKQHRKNSIVNDTQNTPKLYIM